MIRSFQHKRPQLKPSSMAAARNSTPIHLHALAVLSAFARGDPGDGDILVRIGGENGENIFISILPCG